MVFRVTGIPCRLIQYSTERLDQEGSMRHSALVREKPTTASGLRRRSQSKLRSCSHNTVTDAAHPRSSGWLRLAARVGVQACHNR